VKTMMLHLNHIYNTPLEKNVKFVHMSTCGCNMGNCGTLVGVEIDDTNYQTYGKKSWI